MSEDSLKEEIDWLSKKVEEQEKVIAVMQKAFKYWESHPDVSYDEAVVKCTRQALVEAKKLGGE